ncbi:DUF6114 domain-containing protein [Spirillospora sp. CA-255316]
MAGLRGWTRERPFAAGCLLLAAGAEIMLVPVAPVGVIVQSGPGGYAGFLTGCFIMAMGLGLWLAAGQRTMIAVLAVMAALTAFVLANLGGLLLGSLLTIVGASLGFAWRPPDPAPGPNTGPDAGPDAGPGLPAQPGAS